MVVYGVRLDLEECDGGVCIGVRRDDMVSSGGNVLVKWPWEHMGLGGVSFRGGGAGGVTV